MTSARAERLDRELKEWLLSPEALAKPLHELEVEQERRAREVQRLRLQAHLDSRGLGDVGEAVVRHGEKGEEELRHKETHTRRVVTVFGPVVVRRRAYRARRGESVHPLDADLVLPERSFSHEVQRRLVKAAVQGPYDEVVARLREETGAQPCKRTAQQVVVEAARDLEPFYVQRPTPAPQETGPILVGAVDSKGIPIRPSEPVARQVRPQRGLKPNRKRMATIGVVFTRPPQVRTPQEVVESLFREGPRLPEDPPRPAPRPEHKRVFASLLKSREEAIGEVAVEMERRDPKRQKTWVCLMDGDHVLQKLVETRLPAARVVLDFIHVLGYLWKAVYVYHKPTTAKALEWVRTRALWILEGRSPQVVKGLRQSVTKRKLRGQKKKILEAVARYLHRNRKRMRYDLCLAQGLPIASGPVEGACKSVVRDRMERSGMRWTMKGADALVKLRAAYLSGDLEDYWRFHVLQEQQRLHPHGAWTPVPSSA